MDLELQASGVNPKVKTGAAHHAEACAQVKHAEGGCGCGGLVEA